MDHSHTRNIFNRFIFLGLLENIKQTEISYQSKQRNKAGVFSKCSVIQIFLEYMKGIVFKACTR